MPTNETYKETKIKNSPRKCALRHQIYKWVAECGEMGIYLTKVTTTCSVFGRGGLSTRPAGFGVPVFNRGGLSGVSVSTALASWLRVPALWWAEGVAGVGDAVGVLRVPSPDFCDCGNDLSGQPPAIDPLVSGGMVGDQPEERSQRHGLAARVGRE